jgi:hypothetical protein
MKTERFYFKKKPPITEYRFWLALMQELLELFAFFLQKRLPVAGKWLAGKALDIRSKKTLKIKSKNVYLLLFMFENGR